MTIDAASIDTLWEARDEQVRREQFLDVANHPEITFTSTEVELTGKDTAVITGDVTLRGLTSPVSLDAVLNRVDANPFNHEQRIPGFTLTGESDREDFGIDFGAPAIGAVLPITISVELTASADSAS